MIKYKSWKHFLAMTLGIVVGAGFPMWLVYVYTPDDWLKSTYLWVGFVMGVELDTIVLAPLSKWARNER